jgi:hypothetical protein
MTDAEPITLLDVALAYAAQGWPVFPCRRDKTPFTHNGHLDASTDPVEVRRSWRRNPGSVLIGSPTGFGFVVLDIDVREDRDGFATLARLLGSTALPETLTAATPSGGRHLYFDVPDPPIRNTAGERGRGIGAGLDWRGLGGYVILPAPGTGYEWVAELPLAPVPEALLPKPAPIPLIGTPASCSELSDYGEAALRSAAAKILSAPDGEQEATLNGEAYSIGRLAGAGGVPAELALEILLMAGKGMPSHRAGQPWRDDQVEEKVRRAFAQGMAVPRPAWIEIDREIERLLTEAADVDN